MDQHHLPERHICKTLRRTTCMMTAVTVLLSTLVLLVPKVHATTYSRINPATDLQYLGAFLLPDETSNDTSWSYGGPGMTFYPEGDPSGPSDSYSGSLFSIGHPWQSYVSEFTIPEPTILTADDIESIKNGSYSNMDTYLNRAATLQPFTDVTEGRMDSTPLQDIQYYPKQGSQTTDKLYWTMYVYYLVRVSHFLGGGFGVG